MSKRVNIMLPETTLSVLDRVAPRGSRSRFVSAAVLHYVESQGNRSLRERLKAGYLANGARSPIPRLRIEFYADSAGPTV